MTEENSEFKLERGVWIGKPKVHTKVKNGGKPFISFHICIKTGDWTLIVSGFRIIQGRIYPPSTFTGSQYVNIVTGNREILTEVYRMVKVMTQRPGEWMKAILTAGDLVEDVEDAIRISLYNADKMRFNFK